MRALRWTDVLVSLLAARGWAPWFVEPQHAGQRRPEERPQVAPARQARRNHREVPHLPFDDVQ